MIDLNIIKSQQLNDKDIYDQIRIAVFELGFGSELGDALDFLRKLNELMEKFSELKSVNPDLYEKYQELILNLKFITFPLLTEKEAYEVINKNLLKAIKLKINLEEKVRLLYWLYADYEVLEKNRRNLLRALTENDERIGRFNLKRGEAGGEEPPYIKNWIKDFASSLPTNRPVGKLEEVTYFNENENVKKLNNEEKDLLNKVINLYKFLRFPVSEEISVEETGHKIKKLPKELSYPPSIKETKPISYSKLQETYNNFKTQIPVFQGLENRILEKTQGQLLRVKEELVSALKVSDKNQVIACLRILARQGALGNILKENPNWQRSIIDYIKDKYKEQFSQIELNQLIKNFSKLANTPPVFSEFLQYLLKDKLKFSESESALVCVDLIDIFSKKGDNKFAGLVTGNVETGEFEWVKNRIENGELVSEI